MKGGKVPNTFISEMHMSVRITGSLYTANHHQLCIFLSEIDREEASTTGTESQENIELPNSTPVH